MSALNRMIIANFLLLFVLLSVNTNAQRRTLYENDFCKSGDNKWKCQKLSNCPSAQAALKAGERPEMCTFAGLEPIVCCNSESNSAPPSPSRPATSKPAAPTSKPAAPTSKPAAPTSKPATPSTNSISKNKCVEYAKYVFREELPPILLPSTVGEPIKPVKFDECARVGQTLIIGGTDASPREFPHMAQIGYGDSPSIAWLCGGSLISDRFVISAAHCSNPNSRGPAKWARLGDLNIGTDTDDARPIILQISERFDHPDYDTDVLYYDIALYKLEKAVTLSTYIRPACLDLGERTIKEAIATGWGRTEWGGKGSSILKKVNLKLVDTDRCNSSYRGSIGRQLPEGIVGNSMMCAGDREGKDTCQGDSGGPLQIAVTEPYCMYSVIGVTSFGKECGSNTPAIYSRVSHFVPWIESIVWP